jgi:hypothetical protein
MFFTAGNSPPFTDIFDAISKGWKFFIADFNLSSFIEQWSGSNIPEIEKVLHKIINDNSSLVSSFKEGVE